MAQWEVLRRQIAISGQVTAVETGAAVAGACVQITAAPDAFKNRVRLRAKQHGAQWANMPTRLDRAETAVDGAFFFLDLPDGDYTLTAYMRERLPTYDYAENSGQVTRNEQGTIQPSQVNVALPAFSGKVFPPAFAPTDITGCQLWLQAEKLALNDGDGVVSWPDASGQAHEAIQTEAANQPIYKEGLFNGRPALRFDGETHYFTLNIADTATEHTFFAVYDQTPAGGHSNYIFEAQTGRLTLDCAQSSSPYPMRWHDGSWRSITSATAGQQIITWLFAGTTGSLFRNGAQVGTAAYAPTSLGGTVTLAANYQGRSSFFEGDIAEFVYYNRALTDDERQLLEEFLNGRYAIFS